MIGVTHSRSFFLVCLLILGLFSCGGDQESDTQEPQTAPIQEGEISSTPTPVPNTPTPAPNTPTPVPNTPTPVPNTPTPTPTVLVHPCGDSWVYLMVSGLLEDDEISLKWGFEESDTSYRLGNGTTGPYTFSQCGPTFSSVELIVLESDGYICVVDESFFPTVSTVQCQVEDLSKLQRFSIFSDDTEVDGFHFNSELMDEFSAEINIGDEGFIGGIESTENEQEQIQLQWNPESQGFFAGISSRSENGIDLRQYSEGYLVLEMEIPRNVGFQVGVIDANGASNWVSTNAWSYEYGLVRLGSRDRVVIPLQELANDNINFEKVRYPFAIRSQDENLPSESFELLIDEVFWEALDKQ